MLTLMNPHRFAPISYLTPGIVDYAEAAGDGNDVMAPTLSGATAGNLLVVFCSAHDGEATFALPSGFLSVGRHVETDPPAEIVTGEAFVKVAAGGETVLNVSANLTSNDAVACQVFELENVNAADPIEDVDAQKGAISLNVTISQPCLLLGFCGNDSDRTPDFQVGLVNYESTTSLDTQRTTITSGTANETTPGAKSATVKIFDGLGSNGIGPGASCLLAIRAAVDPG